MSWQQLSSEEKYKNPWITITEDKVETDSGKVLTWGVVHQKDSGFVIPWDGERFVVVGLYRYPTDIFSWEFPAGGAEDDQNMEDVAKREFEEETGIVAGSMERLGKFCTQNGISSQWSHVFLATNLSNTGTRHLDEGEEGMQLKRVTYAELCTMMNKGEFVDGQGLAAFAYLHTSGWIKEQGL